MQLSMVHKVDFVIAGFQKCGTTTLADKLAQHPEINFARQKEPHFFSKGKLSKDDYLNLFEWESIKIRGEGSTSYSFIHEYPDVVRHLHDHNPDLKIIFIGRDPVERIRSHYSHKKLRGILDQELGKNEVIMNPEYIERTLYTGVIREYQKLFSRKQMFILSLEALVSQPEVHLGLLQHFLGISKFSDTNMVKKNSSLRTSYSTKKWGKVRKHPIVRVLPYKLKDIIKRRYFTNRLDTPIQFNDEIIRAIRARTNEDYTEFLEMVNNQPKTIPI